MKTNPKDSLSRRLAQIPIFASIVTLSLSSYALTITSGPTFSTSSIAPLTGDLQLTTDAGSRVSVSVSDGQSTWERDFFEYATNHSVPLLGFEPGRTNLITVTARDRFGHEVTSPQPLVFVTAPLPGDFSKLTLLKSVPDKMEPGYTLFRLINASNYRGYMTIVNSAGQVVWYSGAQSVSDIRQLKNGDLFFPLRTGFVEMNMLGQTVRNWQAPTGLPVDVHEGLPTDHGTILYMSDASRVVTNFPTSSTDPNAPTQTTNVAYQPVVEISATNASVLHVWAPIDMIDPTRVDYLTFSFRNPLGVDWEHGNAVIEDPHDDSIIVSMRHQDALIKFSRETGKLIWILSSHANWKPEYQPYLLNPVGTPFGWTYGQHGPMLTPQGTLLVYDDGNYRASPFEPRLPDADNYSRAVEYRINEKTMQISQVWDYGRTNSDRLYTDRVGNTDWLPHKGNVLMTFGYVLYENGVHPDPYSPSATMLRIKEVTHDANPEVVFDLACFDYNNTSPSYLGTAGYRSHRIPDLYPVVTAAGQVADLMTAVGSLDTPWQRLLVAMLGSVVTSIGEGDLQVAAHRLGTFQLLTRLARLQPEVEAQVVDQAQGIRDALLAGKTSYASEDLTGIYPFFSSTHALADLIDEVGGSDIHIRRILVTILTSALTSLADNDQAAASRNLQRFQALLRIAREDPALASQFKFEAQRIIDALPPSPGTPPWGPGVHGRGRRPRLTFSEQDARTYVAVPTRKLLP